MEIYEKIERNLITIYRKNIWRRFIKGIKEFEMIKPNDKIAVCISGGKDSMLLAKCMQEFQKHNEVSFDLEFICMDPGYSIENLEQIKKNAYILNIPIKIFKSDIFECIEKMEDRICYLCARMRRGYLYKKAQSLGCNKIALGHHFDDVIETVLMGMFYGAQMQTMMPKLHSTNHQGMELIRPLYFVKEDDIIKWQKDNQLEFIKCACKITNKQNASKREEIKDLIKNLRNTYENIDINIYNSTKKINLSTIISYMKDGKEHNFLDDYDKERND